MSSRMTAVSICFCRAPILLRTYAPVTTATTSSDAVTDSVSAMTRVFRPWSLPWVMSGAAAFALGRRAEPGRGWGISSSEISVKEGRLCADIL